MRWNKHLFAVACERAGASERSNTAMWLATGLLLDLAVWAATASVPPFAANPGFGSAFTLCFIHAFVLPPLLTGPRPKRLGVLRGLLAGAAGAPLALVVGFVAGFIIDGLAVAMLALISPAPGAPYQPHSAWVLAVESAVVAVALWSGFVGGAIVTALIAAGVLAAVSRLPRPRSLWRVALAGACASLVFLPDWWLQSLKPPLREPVLLMSAALPSLLLGASTFDRDANALDNRGAGRLKR